MAHAFVTIAVPTRKDLKTRAAIEATLDGLGNLANPEVQAALDTAGVVHFMSSSLVRDADPSRDRLLIEISADGTTAATLSLFDGLLRPHFEPLLELAGLESGRPSTFLEEFVVTVSQGLFGNPGLNFAGSPGHTVKRIRAERDFSRIIRGHLEDRDVSSSPLAIVDEMRARVKADPAAQAHSMLMTPKEEGLLAPEKNISSTQTRIKLALAALPTFFLPHLIVAAALALMMVYYVADDIGDRSWFFVTLARLIGLIGAFLLCAIAIIGAALAIGIVMLRRAERREKTNYSMPDSEILAEARKREDQGSIQNHLTGVSTIKPSPWRWLSLRIGFFMILQNVILKFRPGHLGNIGTIHFARWAVIPGTDKLVFFSNYGGSWESYLEDFITKAANGLTAAWSNTVGFPETRLLLGKGARDGDVFKRWARRQQIPTRFWYVAYPDITTAHIRKNAAIRNGFARVKTEDEAAAFLALFASRTRPALDVERGEVQTLLFGGLKRHEESAALMLRLPEDRAKARAWVDGVREEISFGNAPDPFRVNQIALSAAGLAHLGLSKDEIAQFGFAFAQGMGNEDRASALGDIGDDAPDQWDWGGGAPIDAVYFVYVGDGCKTVPDNEKDCDQRDAKMHKNLREAIDEVEAKLKQAGGRVEHTVMTTNLSTRKGRGASDIAPKEPFGFADGISQPTITGLARGHKLEQGDQHRMMPGEFILGYPDNRGYQPLSPQISAARDPANLLPVADHAHDQTDYPVFENSGANLARDIGRNGTFLVVRQLEQKVAAFKAYSKACITEHAGHPGIPSGLTREQQQQYLEAKMMGRWQDGTSMVRFPQEPGTGWNGDKDVVPDNDYLLGRDDPTGEACPFGSHVRRSNPRDSFTPGDKVQLDIVNRHRILRRGRFYKDGSKEGLLFVCANADIERQFEFIQQTWSVAAHFHGLEGEVDPILGRGDAHSRMTIPTPNGPIFLRNIPDLIRMVGGEYFFMPSKSTLRYLSALKD